jgi:hypothetical protein
MELLACQQEKSSCTPCVQHVQAMELLSNGTATGDIVACGKAVVRGLGVCKVHVDDIALQFLPRLG